MGGSGGGGSSGKVEYPAYMQSRHETWLAAVYSDISVANPYTNKNAPSISALTSTSSANTNFKAYLDGRKATIDGWLANDPIASPMATELFELLDGAITALNAVSIPDVDEPLENQITELSLASFTQVLDAHITALAEATFSSNLDTHVTALANVDDLEGAVDVETVLYPRFEAGMRDINAVQSSAFVIGKALMESDYASRMIKAKYEMLGASHAQRDMLKKDRFQQIGTAIAQRSQAQQAFHQTVFQAREALVNIRLAHSKQKYIDKQALVNDLWKLQAILAPTMDQGYQEARKMLTGIDSLYDALYARMIDLGRLTVIAENEQAAMDADFDEKAGRWKLENWQTACNVMASISGGTAVSTKGTNKAQSALAGGLSGAAAGAMIGAQLTAPMPLAGAAIGAAIGIGASFL